MSYCRNKQCKNYRQPTETKCVDIGTNYHEHGVVVAHHEWEDQTICCDSHKFWHDVDAMCEDLQYALFNGRDGKIHDMSLTLEQIEAIERILVPTEKPSLEDELRDLAGIGGSALAASEKGTTNG